MEEKEKILNLLKHVIDPEIGINIVDLGLIYDINITEHDIIVKMTLTTPGCPMHNSMIDGVKNIISNYAPSKKVNVDLIWEPAWTPDRMSNEAREELDI
ncbi:MULTISPECIES: metal-sulfur cluster assembly factor [unclassified Melioribacter]|uniref:metal-sulfur cluster assembly factor n=1 Tax=unclassified Melioribacter TaxID=2627329 RepID=UPI003BCF84C3